MDTIRYTRGGDYNAADSRLASSARGSDLSDQSYTRLSIHPVPGGRDDTEIYIDLGMKYPMLVYRGDDERLPLFASRVGLGVDFSGKTVDVSLSGERYGDVLRSGSGNDALYGDGGNDVLVGGAGGDWLYGSDGSDTASYEYAAGSVTASLARPSGNRGEAAGDSYDNIENLRGGAFADRLTGDGGNNVLDGRGGTDVLTGGAGDDTYHVDQVRDAVTELAGGGHDTVLVAAGVTRYALLSTREIEVVKAQDAADTAALKLYGSMTANTLVGNAGNNLLNGGGGADTMEGGAGNDTYFIDDPGDVVIEAAGGGNDLVNATTCVALRSDAEVETVRLLASTGSAALDLAGSDFANALLGNAGANRIDGGLGRDTLYGSAGADTFVFATAPGTGNVDTIKDFKPCEDTIELDGGVFAALKDGPLCADAFKDLGVRGAAIDDSDRILYDRKTGVLSYDADGSGSGAAAVQIALLSNKATLTFADILIA